jgi:hypothetical protein
VARRGSHPALGRSADGQELPAPRSAETLGADPEVAQAIAEGSALAPLLLDAGLLAAIDDTAAARGLTRSAFLASAAPERIESGS